MNVDSEKQTKILQIDEMSNQKRKDMGKNNCRSLHGLETTPRPCTVFIYHIIYTETVRQKTNMVLIALTPNFSGLIYFIQICNYRNWGGLAAGGSATGAPDPSCVDASMMSTTCRRCRSSGFLDMDKFSQNGTITISSGLEFVE